MATKITYTDLLKALEDAKGINSAEGLTTLEWAEEWGCSVWHARARIRQAMKHGLMASGQVVRPEDLRPWRNQRYTVYRYIPPKDAA